MNHLISLYGRARINSLIQYLLLMLMVFSILSCASSGQPKKVISLSLVASADLNPDINNRPSPVAVTIYQLTNASSFRKSDYMSLSENSKVSLGRDLIAINNLTLRPGQVLDLEYPVAKSERAFAIVVGYRVIEASGWQLVYEYPRKGSGFWTRFGGKEVSAHKVLLKKNRIQFGSLPQEN